MIRGGLAKLSGSDLAERSFAVSEELRGSFMGISEQFPWSHASDFVGRVQEAGELTLFEI